MEHRKPLIAYTRQSRAVNGETEDDSLSLEQQVDSIKEFADRNGYQLIRVIKDHDITGRTMDRPGIHELRATASPGMTVAVYKFDRLARSVGGMAVLVDELEKSGARVVSVTEPDGKLPRQMLSVMAEYYSDALSERIMAIRESQARRGDFTGGHPPYGYMRRDAIEAINRKGKPYTKRTGPIVVNPDEAPIVKEVFARFLAGESPYAIADDLHSRGERRALGGLWTSTEIHEMFQTPFYAGYATHKGIIVAEGKHEPLVSPETFTAAQERAKRIANVRNVSPHQVTSWLEGLVEHKCGARMYLSHTYGPKKMDGTRNTFANFVCKNASGIHACGLPQVSIAKRKLEAAVRKRLVSDLHNVVSLDDAVARAEREAGGQPAKDARKEIEARRAKLNRRYDRARELWLDGGDSLEQWKQTKAEHDAEIAALDAELANLPAPPDPNRFRDAATMLGSFAAVAIQASDDALKLALEQLGTAVVSDDGVRIRYHHPFRDFIGDTSL